jgi:peptidoglycan/xylan/chitin deacetylase (PgdA/CDA1 family)
MIETFAISAGCAGVLGGAHFLPQVCRYTNASSLCAKAVKTRSLVLTYDDGPAAISTPKLLLLLEDRNAKATFFVLGRNAEAHPEIMDRLVLQGHEIGCHGYAHPHAWKVAPWTSVHDITRGYDVLSRWMPPNGVFRPPYGKFTLATWLTLRKRGAPIAVWTLDSEDTHARLPSINTITEQFVRAGGGVVLMHDFDRSAERMEFSLNMTSALLDIAKREGINTCRLGDLCARAR